MSENEWVYQLSVKIEGQHLLNLRANDAVAFKDSLAWATENREPILAACAALEGTRTPDRPTPSPTTGPGPSRSQKATSGEVGPVGINGVDVASTKKDGSPMKSPKYTVNFSNGKRFSTFDSLVADAARELQGGLCYYTTVQNGDYVNLGTVRGASS